MSTIKTKNIQQKVISGTTQPLKIGGIASDFSDAKISIDTSGNLTASNLTATLNGLLTTNGQIKFPATQNPSADANTLDDYEEGTFTPTIVGSLTAGTGTYSVQEGKYTKIGNTVYFQIRLSWSAHTGTGAMKAYGLPFTVTGNVLTPIISYPSGITMSSGNVMQCLISNIPQWIDLNQNPVGGSGNDTNLSIDTAGTLFLAGTYLTN